MPSPPGFDVVVLGVGSPGIDPADLTAAIAAMAGVPASAIAEGLGHGEVIVHRQLSQSDAEIAARRLRDLGAAVELQPAKTDRARPPNVGETGSSPVPPPPNLRTPGARPPPLPTADSTLAGLGRLLAPGFTPALVELDEPPVGPRTAAQFSPPPDTPREGPAVPTDEPPALAADDEPFAAAADAPPVTAAAEPLPLATAADAPPVTAADEPPPLATAADAPPVTAASAHEVARIVIVPRTRGVTPRPDREPSKPQSTRAPAELLPPTPTKVGVRAGAQAPKAAASTVSLRVASRDPDLLERGVGDESFSEAPEPARPGLFARDPVTSMLLGLGLASTLAAGIAYGWVRRDATAEGERLEAELREAVADPIAVELKQKRSLSTITAELNTKMDEHRSQFLQVWLLCVMPLGLAAALLKRPR